MRSPLEGRKLVLCVCGSIAAVEVVRIARELARQGVKIRIVANPSALDFIGRKSLEFVSNDGFLLELSGRGEHVSWVRDCDAIAVVPATANTICKFASGIADTPVTLFLLTALGFGKRIVMVPAMNLSLYDNPLVSEAISKLRNLGVEFVEPRIEEGKAKLAEMDRIVDWIARALYQRDLEGRRFLVTAGPTISMIDDVRFLSNRSSGRMGIEIAREAWRRGAEVTLIHGRISVKPPAVDKIIAVSETEEMLREVRRELEESRYDVMISAAAPLDFRVRKRSGKLDSRSEHVIELEPVEKIVEVARRVSPDTFIVGFKLEHGLTKDQLREAAYRKLLESNLDLVVANDSSWPGCGFEVETNKVLIVDREGNVIETPLAHKSVIARLIIDEVVKRISG